jgi:hypothetical protein
MVTNCVQPVKPPVADGASVEMDRRAVGVPSEPALAAEAGQLGWDERRVLDGHRPDRTSGRWRRYRRWNRCRSFVGELANTGDKKE